MPFNMGLSPAPVASSPPVRQVSPDKNVNARCTPGISHRNRVGHGGIGDDEGLAVDLRLGPDKVPVGPGDGKAIEGVASGHQATAHVVEVFATTHHQSLGQSFERSENEAMKSKAS